MKIDNVIQPHSQVESHHCCTGQKGCLGLIVNHAKGTGHLFQLPGNESEGGMNNAVKDPSKSQLPLKIERLSIW